MIDSHCHLNASYTSDTVTAVLDKFIAKGGEYVIDVSTNLDELAISQKIIASHADKIYSNIGIHPEYPDGKKEVFYGLLDQAIKLESLLPTLNNIVGIGETGIDYSHTNEFTEIMATVLEQQRELFTAHIGIATRNSLPLTIHARGEHNADYRVYLEVLELLNAEKFSGKVYFHSFGGNYDIAKKILDQGYFLGVNGIATYSGAKDIAEVVEKAPISSILLETDAPFLIPSNMNRAELESPRVNEPIGIFSTAKRIAALKKSHEQEILEAAQQNALQFFERIL